MAVIIRKFSGGDEKIQFPCRYIGNDLALAGCVVINGGAFLYVEAVVKHNLLTWRKV